MSQKDFLGLRITLPDKEEKTIVETIPHIIKGNVSYMIAVARITGEYLGQELPKRERLYLHQIRKVFGSIKKIQMKKFDRKSLLLLKPQLIFTSVKNDSNLGIQILRDILVEAIEHVEEKEEYFKNFVDFLEAILAYHQAAEKS